MAAGTNDPLRPRPTDMAFLGGDHAGSGEPTYAGALSFMRRRYTRDLAGVDVAIMGVPLDVAVSNRAGARFGPQAVRRASAILDGDPQYPFHFDPFEVLKVVDWGDAVFDYARPWEAHDCIHAQAVDVLASGAKLFALGGDHSITYPLLVAHAERHGPLAIVHFDAHQDTWGEAGAAGPGHWTDHGAFVRRGVEAGVIDAHRSIQIGIRTHAPRDCGLEIVWGWELETKGIREVIERIHARVGEAKAYMTFDIDCLDPAFAPGTGTPVAGGLTSREALAILRELGRIDFVGGDVVEVAPPYDHADLTAIAGAAVAQTWLGLEAEKRRAHRG